MITDFHKNVVLLMSDNNSSNKECKNILREQNEGYLSYIKNEEKTIIEDFLKK